MGQILTETVNRAVTKGWIPQGQSQQVIQRIEQLGGKYNFSPDDFAIFTHTESEGMDPTAWNAGQCAGIIQFCPSNTGTGIKTISGRAYKTSEIRQMSVLEQLDLADLYFSDVIPRGQRGDQKDLGHIYFYVLYPGIGQRWSGFQEGADLRSEDSALTEQAAILYEGGSTNTPLTKESVRNGLKKKAAANLGNDIVAAGSDPASYTGTATAGAGGILGQFGFSAGLVNGALCDEPPVITLEDAITYVGCPTKNMGPAPLRAGGYGSNVPMNLNGNTTYFQIGDFEKGLIIPPGSLRFPFKRSDVTVVSPFCKRRERQSRPGSFYRHAGTDWASTLGRGKTEGYEVVAVADGRVARSGPVTNGYDPGWVDIVCPQFGNLLVRYGHVIPLVQGGVEVKQGDVIAKVGPYNGDNAHLHLELRMDKGVGGSPKDDIQDCKNRFLDPVLFCKNSP